MMKYICTYFDYNFLSRGLILYNSIKKYHSDFRFFVLAFDQECYDYLASLNEEKLIPISFKDYNAYFNTSIDKYEDKKQYFFSSTPNFCIYLLEKFQDIDILLYLDADVCVYESLDPIYEEFGDASIGVCSHRFHPVFRLLSKNYGIFNVGVNLFKRSSQGLKCLHDWKKDCDNWYPNKPDYPLNFFSDQIFLDIWPDKYSELIELKNIGVDVAPWNMLNYKFSKKGQKYLVNDTPLIIYHFSSLRKCGENLWNANTIFFFGNVKGAIQQLYKDYIHELESTNLNNEKISELSHTNSLVKRIFYYFMKFILNEHIKL